MKKVLPCGEWLIGAVFAKVFADCCLDAGSFFSIVAGPRFLMVGAMMSEKLKRLKLLIGYMEFFVVVFLALFAWWFQIG